MDEEEQQSNWRVSSLSVELGRLKSITSVTSSTPSRPVPANGRSTAYTLVWTGQSVPRPAVLCWGPQSARWPANSLYPGVDGPVGTPTGCPLLGAAVGSLAGRSARPVVGNCWVMR